MAVLEYLGMRPYREVHKLVQGLQAMPQIVIPDESHSSPHKPTLVRENASEAAAPPSSESEIPTSI
jgi:hypothetical protein